MWQIPVPLLRPLFTWSIWATTFFNFTVLNLTALYPNAVTTKAQIKQNMLRKFKAVLHKVARMTMTPHTAHHGRTWLIMPISNGWSSGNMSRNVL